MLPPTEYESSIHSANFATVCPLHFSYIGGCVLVLVLICIFLISDYIDHLFLSVLDISILALSSKFLLMFILSCPSLFIFSKFWGSKDSFRFTEKLIWERWKVIGYANIKRKVFTCNSGRQSLIQELLLEIKSIIS